MDAVEYRKMAAVEDAMWYYRALHRVVTTALGRAALPAQAAVLDAGCGTGGLLRRLRAARPGWAPVGLDFSPLACALARERTGLAVTEGSVTALPFAAGTFDAVVSCDVVCQVEDPAAAIREFHRVLRPGGVAVLTMPAYRWMHSYHDRAVGNRRRYSRAETAALLRAAGLTVAYATYWNTLLFPLAVLQRKVLRAAAADSDVRLYPAPVEAICNAMNVIEHAWLRRGGRLPWGNSVLAVGRRP
ncbi:MAG: class I SAM-dependent methyltransferase [Opitutaceae bacterium]|nr:class I SAM-dependent methyltransferase [Opitutaceae bacterium]